MATSDAKHRFLEAVARLYATTAPAASAHLKLRANAEAVDGKKVVVRDESTCKACGRVLIPGWTSLTRIVGPDAKAKLSARSTITKKKALVVECLGCHRYVKTPLDAKIRAPTKRVARQAHVSTDGSAEVAAKPVLENGARPAATNSSSKQRAKSRKQGGLQAMLDRSKKQPISSPGSGLDLMDFMKQG